MEERKISTATGLQAPFDSFGVVSLGPVVSHYETKDDGYETKCEYEKRYKTVPKCRTEQAGLAICRHPSNVDNHASHETRPAPYFRMNRNYQRW